MFCGDIDAQGLLEGGRIPGFNRKDKNKKLI
jgi:hypothetical protein